MAAKTPATLCVSTSLRPNVPADHEVMTFFHLTSGEPANHLVTLTSDQLGQVYAHHGSTSVLLRQSNDAKTLSLLAKAIKPVLDYCAVLEENIQSGLEAMLNQLDDLKTDLNALQTRVDNGFNNVTIAVADSKAEAHEHSAALASGLVEINATFERLGNGVSRAVNNIRSSGGGGRGETAEEKPKTEKQPTNPGSTRTPAFRAGEASPPTSTASEASSDNSNEPRYAFDPAFLAGFKESLNGEVALLSLGSYEYASRNGVAVKMENMGFLLPKAGVQPKHTSAFATAIRSAMGDLNEKQEKAFAAMLRDDDEVVEDDGHPNV